jgi:hypothetical protein
MDILNFKFRWAETDPQIKKQALSYIVQNQQRLRQIIKEKNAIPTTRNRLTPSQMNKIKILEKEEEALAIGYEYYLKIYQRK